MAAAGICLWGAVTGFDALDLQVHGPSMLE
jgi:hypothetical protein